VFIISTLKIDIKCIFINKLVHNNITFCEISGLNQGWLKHLIFVAYRSLLLAIYSIYEALMSRDFWSIPNPIGEEI